MECLPCTAVRVEHKIKVDATEQLTILVNSQHPPLLIDCKHDATNIKTKVKMPTQCIHISVTFNLPNSQILLLHSMVFGIQIR